METYQNYVGGEWTQSSGSDTLLNLNPATGEPISEFPNSNEQDVLKAVEYAQSAQPAWAGLSAQARGEFLRKAADAIERRTNEIATGLMQEEGKSLPEAKGETGRGVLLLRYYAMHGMLPDGEVIPSANPRTLFMTRREPLGVVSLITPWNFPIAIPIWKLAPALAYGNTVVLKPSELAPLTAHRIAECFHEVGLPNGVLNVIHGEGSRVGHKLCTHPAVKAISFTGSVCTGKQIAAWAAEHGKKYQLEMGGKNASIILADADLEQAVNLTIQGAFKSAGEKCTATSRVIVQSDVYDEVRQMLVERISALKVGPGDGDAYLGPVISSSARDRILAAIGEAISRGGTVLAGGGVPSGDLTNGFYVNPTLVEVDDPASPIAQDEVFGPVLCLLRATTNDEAIDLANNVQFGLSASLFTRNLNSALNFAERIQAGLVRINGETAGVEPQAPFGGYKGSSSYSREQGLAAREFYTQVKTISVDRSAS